MRQIIKMKKNSKQYESVHQFVMKIIGVNQMRAIDGKWLFENAFYFYHTNSINKQFTVNVKFYRTQSQIEDISFGVQIRALALTYKKKHWHASNGHSGLTYYLSLALLRLVTSNSRNP